MIALGRDFVSVAWWLPTFPGLAILTTVLAINLVRSEGAPTARSETSPRTRLRGRRVCEEIRSVNTPGAAILRA
jgi:hypothetical protein